MLNRRQLLEAIDDGRMTFPCGVVLDLFIDHLPAGENAEQVGWMLSEGLVDSKGGLPFLTDLGQQVLTILRD